MRYPHHQDLQLLAQQLGLWSLEQPLESVSLSLWLCRVRVEVGADSNRTHHK
jgi:hypothetical protein